VKWEDEHATLLELKDMVAEYTLQIEERENKKTMIEYKFRADMVAQFNREIEDMMVKVEMKQRQLDTQEEVAQFARQKLDEAEALLNGAKAANTTANESSTKKAAKNIAKLQAEFYTFKDPLQTLRDKQKCVRGTRHPSCCCGLHAAGCMLLRIRGASTHSTRSACASDH
jgi:hypothetical protein